MWPETDPPVAHYKAPKHVRIVDELPVTVTGKPQKFVMRDWMVAHGYAGADPAGGSAWIADIDRA